MQTKKMKPIFSMSATLLNKLKWIKAQKTEEGRESAIKQLVETLNKVFVTNENIERGQNFEKAFFRGEHPQFAVDYERMQQQKWFNKYIEYADFTIKLVGKFDLYDPKEKQIYDVKRTLKYYDGKYGDESTIQHDLYMYLQPEAERFWYLVAQGGDDKIIYGGFPVLRKPNLEQYIISHIEEFIQFLYREELLELYFKNYKVDF